MAESKVQDTHTAVIVNAIYESFFGVIGILLQHNNAG